MKIYTISILALGFLFQSCNNKLKVDTATFMPGEPFQMKILETAKMSNGDLQLTLTGIPEDSRCPEDVNCIWEGQVRMFLTAANTEKKENLEFKIDKSRMGKMNKSFGNYSISVENVSPLPTSGTKILKEEYIVTFRVDPK